MLYYTTPFSYKNVDSCGSYTCADLDYYQYAYNSISEGAYTYTFKSSSYYACATVTGICTSSIFNTNNSVLFIITTFQQVSKSITLPHTNMKDKVRL